MTHRSQVAAAILLSCLSGFVTVGLLVLLIGTGTAGGYPVGLVVAAGAFAFATVALLLSAVLRGITAIRKVDKLPRPVAARATSVILLALATTMVLSVAVVTSSAVLPMIADLSLTVFVAQFLRLAFLVHRVMPSDAPRSSSRLLA